MNKFLAVDIDLIVVPRTGAQTVEFPLHTPVSLWCRLGFCFDSMASFRVRCQLILSGIGAAGPHQQTCWGGMTDHRAVRQSLIDPHLMVNNEVDDGCWILQAMRMMFAAFLDDHLDWPAELFVPSRELGRMFLERYAFIGIAAYMNHWHSRHGE